MRSRRFLFALFVAIVMQMASLSAFCKTAIQGQYPAMEKVFGYKDFDFIKIKPMNKPIYGRGTYMNGLYDIHIVKADHYKVVMKVWNREDIELFDINKNGNVLELLSGVRKYPYNSRKASSPRAEVTIYSPTFSGGEFSLCKDVSVSGRFTGRSLSVNASGVVRITGLSGDWDSVVLDLSGGSSMNDISLEAGSIHIVANGAGAIGGKSAFKAGSLSAEMSGGSEIALKSLSVRNVDATMCGASVLSSILVNADELRTTMSGGTSIKFAGNIQSVAAGLSGAAAISLEGTGKSLHVTGSGGSSLESKAFTVKEASVSLSGAASAVLNVTDRLATDVSASATVDYYGKPKSVISKSSNVREH